MKNLRVGDLSRINKVKAKQLFNEGKGFVMCGNKMVPGSMWSEDYFLCPESIEQWKERAETYAPKEGRPAGSLWDGDINKTAWNLMYNNYCAYMTSEEGRYPAYYKVLMPKTS